MKIRKPLKIDQLAMIQAIQNIITDENDLLQCEYDFTMMNPVINGVNNIIRDIKSMGDQLFDCDCDFDGDMKHHDECPLKDDIPYDPVIKFKKNWEDLLSFIDRKDTETAIDYITLHVIIGGNSGIGKALITEAVNRKLIYRYKDNEMFYKNEPSIVKGC